MRKRATIASLLLFSSILGRSSGALAVTDEERSAARAAAGQGADAYDAQQWQNAVDLFSRAEALVHSPIHLVFIGRAEVKLGHWVKAYETFNRVKREGAPADAPPAVKKAVDDASSELALLEPKLPYVTVKVKNPSGDVQVTMDGVRVPPLLLGLMRPVDPGQHHFRATSDNLASDDVTLDSQPTSKQTVELELKAASAAAPAGPATPAAPAPPPPAAAGDTTASSGGTNGLRIASYVALGVGVVGLATGTVFVLKAGSTQKEGDDLCPSSPCDPAKKDLISAKDKDAASQKTLGVIGFGVGGVGIAAGIALFVLSSGQDKAAANEPSITPFIGYRTAGIAGRF